MTTTTTVAGTRPDTLITPVLRDRLARRVEHDAGLDPATAQKIIDQTVGFLGACAANPSARLAPSRLVDHGWHAFILHTAEYSEFCERVAGRFIHHRPTEPGGTEPGTCDLGATIAAIRDAGFDVDPDLWTRGAKCNGNCSQCYAGCADDPFTSKGA